MAKLLKPIKVTYPKIFTLPVTYDDLTPQEVREVREQYWLIQGGSCYYCGEPLGKKPSKKVLNKKITTHLIPKSFFKYPVHLHHCHITGLTLGAVHNYCNAVLWQHHGE